MSWACMVFILNTFDAIATSSWTATGQAQEWNPLMATLIAQGPYAFLLIKITLGAACATLLHQTRQHPLSNHAAQLLTGILANVLALHLLVLRLM